LPCRCHFSVPGLLRPLVVSDLPLVQQMAVTSGFVSVLVLMLYFNDSDVVAQYNHPMILWSSCLVLLYWVSRMSLMAQRGLMDDDPVVFAARDRVSIASIGTMILMYLVAVFL